LAEKETQAVDGMTLLSRAGAFIREYAPHLTPKRYGLRSLKQVLEACDLFDVKKRPNGSGHSEIVLYRSK
jgi:hypothetical protein